MHALGLMRRHSRRQSLPRDIPDAAVPWTPEGPSVPVHNACVLAAEVEAHIHTPAAKEHGERMTREA